jgi:hypothetical protein
MVPGIFKHTPKRNIDLLRCHTATTYMGNQKFWYFVKLQYPDIFQQMIEKRKSPERSESGTTTSSARPREATGFNRNTSPQIVNLSVVLE